MNIEVQLQIAKSRLVLNKNAEHDQKSHGRRYNPGESGDENLPEPKATSKAGKVLGRKYVSGFEVTWGRSKSKNLKSKFFVDVDGDITYHETESKAKAAYKSRATQLRREVGGGY